MGSLRADPVSAQALPAVRGAKGRLVIWRLICRLVGHGATVDRATYRDVSFDGVPMLMPVWHDCCARCGERVTP